MCVKPVESKVTLETIDGTNIDIDGTNISILFFIVINKWLHIPLKSFIRYCFNILFDFLFTGHFYFMFLCQMFQFID